MATSGPQQLRIDKWLWFVRFYKTRSLATAAVRGGHVQVNGERAKPGLKLAPGDAVSVRRDGLTYDLVVVDLPGRRGPASEMQECYEEGDESRARRQAKRDSLRADRRLLPQTSGKPDKRTRRALRSLRGGGPNTDR